jgi:hypothetical protein
MKRRVVLGATILVFIFVIGLVGASLLNLTGSDSAPGEAKTNAACAGALVVKTPVRNLGHDANDISNVSITGDMTNCTNQTIKVEVDLEGPNHAYAIRKIGPNTTSLVFNFDAATGDFTDTTPTALNGDLVSQGLRLPPQSAQAFGLVTVTIAKTWE